MMLTFDKTGEKWMGFVDPREEVLCSIECAKTNTEEMFLYTSITEMQPGNSEKHQSAIRLKEYIECVQCWY